MVPICEYLGNFRFALPYYFNCRPERGSDLKTEGVGKGSCQDEFAFFAPFLP